MNGDGNQQTEEGNASAPVETINYVRRSTSKVYVPHPIRLLETLLESTTDAAVKRNIQAAIDLTRSGVIFKAGEMIAAGTLMKIEDWDPSMGTFFLPVTYNLRRFTLYPETGNGTMSHKVFII